MYRSERLVIRLNKAERYAIEHLAIFLNIPASTLARALLLHEAQRRGIGQSGEGKSTENNKREDRIMAKKETPPWEYHSHYKGVVIEHRPGLQRRGFASIYHNWYNPSGKLGIFTHHSLANAHAHIDKLYKDLGDKVGVTMEEYEKFVANGYKNKL